MRFRRGLAGASAAALLAALLLLAGGCASVTYEGARLRAVQASPQWQDGHFVNPLPRQTSSLWDLMCKAINGPDHDFPEQDVPHEKRQTADFTGSEGLRATWLGHSTVLVEIDGQRVLTDPVWAHRVTPVAGIGPTRFFEPPLPIDQVPPIDVVVISHDHYDHLDEDSIAALKDKVTTFAVPLGIGYHLEEWGVRPEQIAELDWWQDVQVGGLTVTATPARHFSGRKLNLYEDLTLWAGWAVSGPNHRMFYSGDTALHPTFADIGDRLGPFDVTLMETGAYDALWVDVHMGPEQAVLAHQLVRGRVMLPVHWGTYNMAIHGWTEPVERVIEAARRAKITLAIPRPGQTMAPANPPLVERWWPFLPWNKAQDDPVMSTSLPQVMQDAVRRLHGLAPLATGGG